VFSEAFIGRCHPQTSEEGSLTGSLHNEHAVPVNVVGNGTTTLSSDQVEVKLTLPLPILNIISVTKKHEHTSSPNNKHKKNKKLGWRLDLIQTKCCLYTLLSVTSGTGCAT